MNNAPHAASTDAMTMCFGYVVPVCYVIMPTVETSLPWQDPQAFQCEGWSQHEDSKKHWGQSRHKAPGTWSKPHGTSGSSALQRGKAKKSNVVPQEKRGSCKCEATTVILRNLPLETTRDMLLQILDTEGFSGGYDFVHLPVDFQTRSGLGYALVNLVSHDVALSVHRHFEGFRMWPCPSDNVCEVAWNSPHQGFETHIERYRNSPLMHPSVPEAFRPLVFVNGCRVDFPAPTTRIRAPRIRHQKPDESLKPQSSRHHIHLCRGEPA